MSALLAQITPLFSLMIVCLSQRKVSMRIWLARNVKQLRPKPRKASQLIDLPTLDRHRDRATSFRGSLVVEWLLHGIDVPVTDQRHGRNWGRAARRVLGECGPLRGTIQFWGAPVVDRTACVFLILYPKQQIFLKFSCRLGGHWLRKVQAMMLSVFSISEYCSSGKRSDISSFSSSNCSPSKTYSAREIIASK